MQVLVAAAALLLLATGVVKLGRPGPTAMALAALIPALPMRRTTAAARALGGVEVVSAVLALAAPGPIGAVAVSACYLGFAGYVAAGLRDPDTLTSCGCAGRADTPVTRAHLALNLTFALAGAVAAVGDERAPLRAGHLSGATLTTTVLAGLTAYAGWLIVTVHPQVVAARRSLRSTPRGK